MKRRQKNRSRIYRRALGLTKGQTGRCRVCRKRSRLVADHCHRTEMPRAPLCLNCNAGLGMFGDSSRVLRAAANYVQSWKHAISRRVKLMASEQKRIATTAKKLERRRTHRVVVATTKARLIKGRPSNPLGFAHEFYDGDLLCSYWVPAPSVSPSPVIDQEKGVSRV